MKNDFVKTVQNEKAPSELVNTLNCLSKYKFPKKLTQCIKLENWARVSSGKTHKIAAMMTAITIASASTAEKFSTETHAPTSLYTILVLPTGSGKDAVAKITAKLIPNCVTSANVTSIGALEDMILASPALTHIMDEFGDILANMLFDKGQSKKEILAMLKSIYGSWDSDFRLREYSSQGGRYEREPRIVKNPAYGICGLSTLEQLMDRLNEKMISDGFLNRFIIVNGEGIPPDITESPSFEVSPEICDHIDILKNTESGIIKMDADCSEFYHKVIGDADVVNTDINIWVCGDVQKREMSVRWRENSIRLATALAAYEQFETLPLWLLKWSYSFVKFNSISFLKTFENRKNKSEFTNTLSAVVKWFSSHRGKWKSKTYIASNATRVSAMPAKERNIILDELVERGNLIKKTDGGVTSYRYK